MKKYIHRLSFALLGLSSFFFIGSDVSAASCPGITRGEHPTGLTHPAFNCYTDNYRLAEDFGGDSNENNFLRVRKDGGNWQNSVSGLSDGDVVWSFTFIHNSATDGQYPANSVSAQINWGDPSNIVSTISASNASPSVVSDTAGFILPTGGILVPKKLILSPSETEYELKSGATSITIPYTSILGSYSNSRGYFVQYQVYQPGVEITKSSNPASETNVPQGETIRYTIQAENTNSINLANVISTDELDANLEFVAGQSGVTATGQNVTLNFGDLNKGITKSLWFDVRVRQQTPAGTEFCNNANITGAYWGRTINSTSNQVCHRVGTPIPLLQINKLDANQADQDGNIGNDTQTIASGEAAVFAITVTNNHTENIINVAVTDALSPTCNLTVAQALVEIAADGNGNNDFEPGESFTYNCTDPAVQAGYTNTAVVDGVGEVSQTPLTDSDPTIIIIGVPQDPLLDINKLDLNPADIDGVQRNDTQTITQGSAAIFEITVRNNHTENIINVAVTDALSPSCNLTEAQALVHIAANGNSDNNFNPGESFTYTCTDSSVQSGYTNTAVVNGIGQVSLVPLTDNDPTVIIIDNSLTFCGDGAIQTPNGVGQNEQCDLGALNGAPGSTCSATCTLNEGGGFCGDGVIQNPNSAGIAEECDDGELNGEFGMCSTSCTRGGGPPGGPSSVPTVGTCVNNAQNNALQCVSRKPVEFGPGWSDYQACVAGDADAIFVTDSTTPGYTQSQQCAYVWAISQGFITCGDSVGGAIHPHENNHNNVASCKLPEPPGGIVSRGSGCEGCFGGGAYIKKEANKTRIARGDEVGYNIKLTLGLYDIANYTVLDGSVKIYDFTIPTDGGSLWGRKGISGGGFVEGPAGGLYMKKTLDSVDIQAINAGGTEVELDYTMSSALASHADTASIDNVAFGVVTYRYVKKHCDLTIDPNCADPVTREIFIPGQFQNADAALNAWKARTLTASFSSLGDTASVEIIRPFVKASNGGNLGFEVEKNERVTGMKDEYTDGVIFLEDNTTEDESLFDEVLDGYTAIGSIDPLKSFQTEEIDKYYDNLRFNTLPIQILGKDFEKTPIQEVYFLDSEDLDLDGRINLGGKNKTFIINDGDLNIGPAGVQLDNGFAAFIVRNGNIIFDKDVTNLEGIFIAETGQLQSSDISRVQLEVTGALMGDIAPLLNDRWFIGDNPDVLLEPNVEIEFDLRLLEDTPPALEQFLGSEWREGLE